MQLISLRTSKSRRFKFNMHDVITYVPSAPEQVILGTNGCGKSYMLSQIYNLLPSSAHFFPGGSQEHICQHRGKLFKATSTYDSKAGHHSFCVSMDGEEWQELNESGLQSDQKILIKEHIGLDQDLMDLAAGVTRFSSMDNGTRRKWLMRICGTDFDDINRLHLVLKRRHRDFKGTIETLTESLTDIVKDIEALTADVKDNTQEFDDLQQLTNNISNKLEEIGWSGSSVKDLREALSDTADELKVRSKTLLLLLSRRPDQTRYISTASVHRILQMMELDVSSLQGQQRILEKRLKDVMAVIDTIGEDNLREPTAALSQLESVTAELEELATTVVIPTVDADTLSQMYNDTDVALRRLEPILTSVPHVEDFKALRDSSRVNRDRQVELSKRQFEINGLIEKLALRVDHFEHADSVDCPECKTRFKPGLDQNLIDTYKRKLVSLREELSKNLEESALIGQSLQLYEEVAIAHGQFRCVMEQHASIVDQWDIIQERKLFFTFPTMILTHLSSHLKVLEKQKHYVRLKTLQERLLTIKASLEGDVGHLLETADKLSTELFESIQAESNELDKIKVFKHDISLSTEAMNNVEAFNKQFEMFMGLLEKLHQATLVGHLQEARVAANTRIGTLHTLRSKYMSLVDRRDMILDQIEQSKQKFEVYKLLDKATSPTEGVPADILRNFMELFIAHMNNHISKVWSYSLELTEVASEGALNCQFPMLVAGDDEPVPDFKMGSTGQVSMIDFVFKLVVFALEGLTDYPLLADEFGKDFDEEHREQLINYIKQLMEDRQYSQLFMVSHYSDVYGAFDNAEIVVLHDRNITKPAVYNSGLIFG